MVNKLFIHEDTACEQLWCTSKNGKCISTSSPSEGTKCAENKVQKLNFVK